MQPGRFLLNHAPLQSSHSRPAEQGSRELPSLGAPIAPDSSRQNQCYRCVLRSPTSTRNETQEFRRFSTAFSSAGFQGCLARIRPNARHVDDQTSAGLSSLQNSVELFYKLLTLADLFQSRLFSRLPGSLDFSLCALTFLSSFLCRSRGFGTLPFGFDTLSLGLSTMSVGLGLSSSPFGFSSSPALGFQALLFLRLGALLLGVSCAFRCSGALIGLAVFLLPLESDQASILRSLHSRARSS